MRLQRVLQEVPPLLLLLVAGAAYLGPSLAHGASLGPYDILSTMGLTAHPHAPVHNFIGSDEIEEFIPWQVLAWREVHAGQLPLWNPYGLLGMPLAFNFQSAPFSLPVVLGYLAPLNLAQTVAVVVRLLIAATGAYVFARTLGLSRLSSTLSGLVFELSGAFSIWLGAYEAGVFAFLGWMLAASFSLARGRHRSRDIALVAMVLALALYGGEPQIALLMVFVLGVFCSFLARGIASTRGRRAGRRCLVDHLLATGAGIALALPLYLPGLQLAFHSARARAPLVSGLPLYDLTHLLFSSYNGVPTAPSQIIGPDNLYVSMLYVGAIPLALAALALSQARAHPEIAGLVVLTAAVLVALFFSPVVDLARHIPGADVFRLLLATTIVDFGLAMLAGFGCEALRSRVPNVAARAWRWLAIVTALLAGVLGVLGVRLVLNVDHLPSAETHQRALSFAWPLGGVALLGALVITHRLGHGALRGPHARAPRHAARSLTGSSEGAVCKVSAHGGARDRRPCAPVGPIGLASLVVVTAGFLVSSGAGIWSSTARPFPMTAPLSSLRRAVGNSLVASGSCARNAFPPVGIVPNVNDVYQVHELAGFDPIIPRTYVTSYGKATHTSTKVEVPPALFCPQITTVALARRYGVGFVLEPHGEPGPPGTHRVATVGGEGLYVVPHSGRATLVTSTARLSPAKVGTKALDAPAPSRKRSTPFLTTVVDASEPSPSSWRFVFDARQRSSLELRVTAVPGWHATIDGRPLRLRRLDDVMLEASVPAGRHVVRLTYWPSAFTIGLVAAAVALFGLLAGLIASRWRRRRADA